MYDFYSKIYSNTNKLIQFRIQTCSMPHVYTVNSNTIKILVPYRIPIHTSINITYVVHSRDVNVQHTTCLNNKAMFHSVEWKKNRIINEIRSHFHSNITLSVMILINWKTHLNHIRTQQHGTREYACSIPLCIAYLFSTRWMNVCIITIPIHIRQKQK